MKLFLSLISVILLNGCVSSSYVSSIGAKAVHGNTSKYSNEVDLAYADRFFDPAFLFDGVFLPYTNLNIDNEPYDTTSVKFKYDDIIWNEDDDYEGSIDLLVKGKFLKFSVHKSYYGSDDVELIHEYRDWYSYPAQSLQVLSVPADVVITTVAVPVIGLGLFIFALSMDPPMH